MRRSADGKQGMGWVGLLALLPLTPSVVAQTTTATASASATIQSTITIRQWLHGNEGDLVFGTISPGTAPGWVMIDPAERNARRLQYSGVVMVDASLISDAQFIVEGDRNREYHITIPSSLVVVSGPNSMLVDNFRCCPESRNERGNRRVCDTSGNLGPNGRDRLHVGATLHVGANQLGGLYEATFPVSVCYQ